MTPATRRILVTCALALALAHAPASADRLPGRGTLEVSPSLAFSYASFHSNGTSDFSATTLDLDTYVGYFVDDRLEVGGSAILSYVSFFGSTTTGGLTGGLTVNFRSGNYAPYLRASVGFLTGTGYDQTNVLAPILEGGARVMVGKSASVNFSAGFRHQLHPGGSPVMDANTILLGVGVSLFPVRGQE